MSAAGDGQIFGTLIADKQQVYDLNYLDDQLVLGIKGTLSVVELKVIRQRLLAGLSRQAGGGRGRDPSAGSGTASAEAPLETYQPTPTCGELPRVALAVLQTVGEPPPSGSSRPALWRGRVANAVRVRLLFLGWMRER